MQMNIVTNTTAWPSVTSAASTGTASTDAAGTAVAAPAVNQVQGHHRHQHQEHHGDGDEHSGQHDPQAYMELKIKVAQTFSALTAPSGTPADGTPSAPATTDAASGGFAAMLKARFSVSEGGMSASVSIRMSAEGQTAGTDLGAQMQGFVQTLYAALHTLFGGNPAGANTTAGTPVSTGAAAALTDASNAPAAAGTVSGTAPTSTAATSAADVTAGTAAGPVGAATTPANAAASPAPATSSLSVRVRLTYNSFGSQLGSLTQQLAQPGAATAAPGMGDLLSELSVRFGQMVSMSPNSGASRPTLSDFLTALAQSFSPATGTSTSSSQAPTSDTTPPVTDPAVTSPPATTSALAPYGQVLSFSASVRSQWLMAA
jgi:hypothetical protein